jgi:ArsR family transcriptional regulator
MTNQSAASCDGAILQLNAAEASLLANRLGALADPVRLQILSMISTSPAGEVCACAFVSHHLKVLAEAGLVDGDKRGRWIWYRLTPGALNAATTALLDATS